MFARSNSKAVVLGLAALLAACGDDAAPSKTPPASATASAQDVERFFAGGALDGGVSVLEAKAAPNAATEVTVRGRVKDLVDGVAVFTLVDASLKACGEDGDDSCTTPWDFCCHDPKELSQSTLTVELRNGAAPIPVALSGVHGIDHLRPVVVRGTLTKDAHQNTTLVASAIRVL
jgi:hypothetical protein